MTVWVSKGLQFPVVYLPFAFNRNVQDRDLVLFHDDDGTRCLHVGGKDSPDFDAVEQLGRAEDASDDSRLTYVALTRAQSQVVAWWAPACDEPNGGLSRLLRGRRPGESAVPGPVRSPRRSPTTTRWPGCAEWEAAGGPVVEESVVRRGPVAARRAAAERPGGRDTSTADRHRVAAHLVLGADPRGRRPGRGQQRAGGRPNWTTRSRDIPLDRRRRRAGTCRRRWPICRAGATFGSLVHAVLETADPFAADLAAELEAQVARALRRGGRSTCPPTSWPRRWCRCTTRRWARWPAA